MSNEFRIKALEIRNFKSIAHASVPLDDDLIILVGENAMGKTAILEAIAAAFAPAVDELSRKRKPSGRVRSIEFDKFRRLPEQNGTISREIYLKVQLASNVQWECRHTLNQNLEPPKIEGSLDITPKKSFAEAFRSHDGTLPVICFYGVGRNFAQLAQKARQAGPGFLLGESNDIRSGYVDSLDSRTVFSDAVEWFAAHENHELRQQREHGPSFRDRRLDAVRSAVTGVMPDVMNMRMVGLQPRLVVDFDLPSGERQSLALDQLSGGFQSFVALVIDLARRMVEINPDLSHPLSGPGLVLIDEIDLHLHPRWQQRIVSQLRQNFPGIQFIVTTHSPQILTTVEQSSIRVIKWTNDGMQFDAAPSVNGATSGRALSEVMGVEERPPADISPFVADLDEYRQLVRKGDWDSDRAKHLLDDLRRTSPDDPVLGALELERRRLSVLSAMGSK